jgi:hypothetical protein
MADTAVPITAGTGTNIDTRTEGTNGNHRQVIVIGDPTTNAGTAPVDGTLGLATFFTTQPTISAVGNFVPAGGTLTAFQGGGAWLTTLATLPVVTNVTGYAVETGGNLDSIVTTLSQIKTKTDNLDVSLGSRLASGGTLPITGTVTTLNAGGSLTAYQGGGAWLTTLATLPVVASILNSSIPVTQSGTWTVQPGNTANTAPWLVTFATIPIVGSIAGQATVTAIQGDAGTTPWLATLATLPVMANVVNSSIPSTQSGTWTVQPGNTPNTTGWLVTFASLSGRVSTLNAGGSLSAFQGGTWTVQPGNTPNTVAWLTTMATHPVISHQGLSGTAPWLVTQATLPVMANVVNSSIPSTQSGTWTVQPGNTANTMPWLVTFATIPIVGDLTVAAQMTVTALQGDPGTKPWLTTLATLPVAAGQIGTWTVQPGNTANTTPWLVTFATIPVVTTVSVAGQATVTAIQGDAGSKPWLMTLATLPVSGTVSTLAAGGSLSAYQSGTWTVQPGNTPNTTAWLTTMATHPVISHQGLSGTQAWLTTLATLPVVASGTVSALNAGGSLSAFQGGTWNVFASLASGTSVVAAAKYLPTLASLTDQALNPLKHDLFSNLMVNTNVPLPNSTKLNRFYTLASMASLMAAPGTGKRLVVRELDFSGNATLAVKLVEDQGGTPIAVWGPHYFLPYAGVTKTQCYIPITTNKSLGVDMQPGGFNASIDVRVETENV